MQHSPVNKTPSKPSLQSTSGGDGTMEISAMAMSNRIPDLWPQSIKLWLNHVEAVMSPQKPSDDVMYQMVIAKLRYQDLQQVSDIIANPPDDHKYATLKDRLIKVYEESAQKQFKKLMEGMELGDQKPSQLLRRMKELAGDTISSQALKFLWGSHLPKASRTILAIHEDKDLSELAEMADAIQENTAIEPVRFLNGIASSATTAPSAFKTTPPQSDIIIELQKKIMQLSLQIEELTVENKHRQSRSSSRNNSRPASPYRHRSRSKSNYRRNPEYRNFSQAPGGLCFYHHFFADKAHKCQQPCSWTKKKHDNNQKN